MTMSDFPLSCFEKPGFEEDGLEFFICNGGGGIAGVRKRSDPAQRVLVHDLDIARNLNMKSARAACGKGRFAVHADASGNISFTCDGDEKRRADRFIVSSKADWTRYAGYLTK
jgi:hypothetical protein